MTPEPRLEGLLPVNKPAGPSSHDMVELVRRRLGIRRVGHTGTLDPFALGLLLLCLNRATRLVEYMHPLPKEYVATALLGVSTTTDDPEGEPTATSDAWHGLARPHLARALDGFLGTLTSDRPTTRRKRSGERLRIPVPAGGRRRRSPPCPSLCTGSNSWRWISPGSASGSGARRAPMFAAWPGTSGIAWGPAHT